MTVGNIRTLTGAYRKLVSAGQKYVPCETGSTDLLADETELFQCQWEDNSIYCLLLLYLLV